LVGKTGDIMATTNRFIWNSGERNHGSNDAPKIRVRLKQVPDWGVCARAANYNAKALAAALRVSVRQLERFFASTQQTTPQRWLNELRLKSAATLLDGTKTIKEVADLVGYKQASHFSREFKNLHGYPPSQFVNKPMSLTDTKCRY
jgi:AraC-like DNA-binding protein